MPRRSLHFVPGGQERMIAKALTLAADGLILDLEDAVPPDRKAVTRGIVRGWLEALDFGGRERWIRMNPIATDLARADLEETIAGRPTGYLVPKPRQPIGIRENRPHPTRNADVRRKKRDPHPAVVGERSGSDARSRMDAAPGDVGAGPRAATTRSGRWGARARRGPERVTATGEPSRRARAACGPAPTSPSATPTLRSPSTLGHSSGTPPDRGAR